MSNLLIIFHSQSGRSQDVALGCYDQANRIKPPDIQVKLRRAFDADVNHFIWADFVLLVTPENFAAIAGGMKDCFDRIFYPAERAGMRAKPYCCIICTGNDGTNAVKQIDTIWKGLGSKPVQPPLFIYGKPDKVAFEQSSTLTTALVSAMEMGIY